MIPLFCVSGAVLYSLTQGQRGAGVTSEAEVLRPKLRREHRVSPSMAHIRNADVHWEERIKAVRELKAPLSPNTLEALYGFLSHKPDFDEGDWYLVCNEIMEVLRKQNLSAELYTDKHLALIQDPAVDPIIRDYAAQHLAQWISGIQPDAAEGDAEKASSAFWAMSAVAADPSNGQLTLVGTTLNALADAVLHGREAMQGKRHALGKLALQILDAPVTIATFNRATAIQVAALLEVPELPARCRKMAQDVHASTDLRLSSIAALGLNGSSEDRALLNSFSAHEDFKYAAAAALARVNEASHTPQ
jgi:hypothetical protein